MKQNVDSVLKTYWLLFFIVFGMVVLLHSMSQVLVVVKALLCGALLLV